VGSSGSDSTSSISSPSSTRDPSGSDGPQVPAPVDAGTIDTGPVAPVRPVIANISYPVGAPNMIVNGEFDAYTDPNVPDGWSVDEIYGYRGMYTPTPGWDGSAVQFVRNSQGRHALAQTVQVLPHHRYTAQMVYEVVATDSRRGGLYIIDPADSSVIATDDINRPSNGWRISFVTFDSGDRTQVKLEIGYLNGMNGTAIYDGVAMFEDDPTLHYQYQTTYRDVIGIPMMPVDQLVPKLGDYVTTLLSMSNADRLAHQTANAATLPYYLYTFLAAPDGDGSRTAWCQRTALAVSELLAMYGVQSHQIHVSPLQHEFIEYYDGAQWTIFDPYFGIRYVHNGVRLGVADVQQLGLDQVQLEVPTIDHVFLIDFGYLQTVWSDTLTLGITMP
jgi:hypothetical protein